MFFPLDSDKFGSNSHQNRARSHPKRNPSFCGEIWEERKAGERILEERERDGEWSGNAGRSGEDMVGERERDYCKFSWLSLK